MNLLRQRIKEIVGQYLKDSSSLDDNSLLKDLGIKSIDIVKIIVDIEQTLNLEILDSDLSPDNFATVSSIEETVKKYFLFRDGDICKCIIVDCDGILWDGIAGEEGVDALSMTPAHYKLHSRLHSLRKKGVLICICTDNKIANVNEALSFVHSELTVDDFAIVCDNAKSKKRCIDEIITSLGFISKNILFIDDSDRICSEISLSGVLPEDMVYRIGNIKNLLILFDRFLSVLPDTEIDRTSQFRSQIERERVLGDIDDYKERNRLLETTIEIRSAHVDDLPRVSELSCRANRFNISGNHLSLEHLKELYNSHAAITTVFLKDRIGDMGMVGFAITKNDVIHEFVISCRALNRGVEFFLLNALPEYPKKMMSKETQNNRDSILTINRLISDLSKEK